MKFKGRVFQYHILSKRLLDCDAKGFTHRACDHIPDEETAVKTILALFRLIQDNSGLVLEYYGLPGSGWVVAYGRHVLGLPVCVMSSPSNDVPVSSDYQSARVLVHIYSAESECKLRAHGNIQDYFVPKSLDAGGCDGWQIDVSMTNLLASHIPLSDPMREICPAIARSLVHDYAEFLANRFELLERDSALDNAGRRKYSTYCLPQIRQRAQGVLT